MLRPKAYGCTCILGGAGRTRPYCNHEAPAQTPVTMPAADLIIVDTAEPR